MKNPIAIIGLSFELPGIPTWRDLATSLKTNETNIGDLPQNRLQDVQEKFGPVTMAKGGYLSSIDRFDPVYFDTTEREATKMFPEHRLFLTFALRAFYTAGYSEPALRGSKTGVFYVASTSAYPNFLDGSGGDFDGLSGIEGTRLANFLDLRGPVLAINTTCSSSLMAVHSACLSLAQNECEKALVGGVKISATTQELAERSVVISKQNHCRPFDQRADGMMNGEGVAFVVLKRLVDAERDNDPIYGVIEGSAVNHGGSRISSLTAPSAEAQQEVVVNAWDQANVDPNHVQFIEAHGTGTILGDPIEYKGIVQAFREKEVMKPVCSISSFKGQIGHLDTMSGIAGLLRLVSAMNNGVKPGQPNFKLINEHIDEASGKIPIQRNAHSWEFIDQCRLGGVSSFGLTGTNIHMVLSQRARWILPTTSEPIMEILQLSEKTQERLDLLKRYLVEFLERQEAVDLALFTKKINRLFNESEYVEALIFNSRADLLDKLRQPTKKISGEVSYLLIDLNLLSFGQPLIHQILSENLLIKEQWEAVAKGLSVKAIFENQVVADVLFQFTLYKYLLSLFGERISVVTKRGQGLLQQLVNKKVTPQDIVSNPRLIMENPNEFNQVAFIEHLLKRNNAHKVVAINFSTDFIQMVKNLPLDIIHINGSMHRDDRYRLYQMLLELGKSPLKVANVSAHIHDLELPYFKLKRFWPEKNPMTGGAVATVSVNEKSHSEEGEKLKSLDIPEIKMLVTGIWQYILEIDHPIGDHDDFFELGGTSLTGLDMLEELEKKFYGIHVTYEEMYSFSTLGKLAIVLHERIGNEKETASNKVIAVTPATSEVRALAYDELIKGIRGIKVQERIKPKAILVTGGTGLVGSSLVESLIEATDVRVFCLIRGTNEVDANNRFWNAYPGNVSEQVKSRIKVICGDVVEKDLGLGEAISGASWDVDTIYHVAGSPAFAGKPDLLENINYVGTRNVFDWANKMEVIRFNYISTIGVCGKSLPAGVTVFYETDLNIGQDTEHLVHAGSKLKAEEYLRQTSSKMEVSVFRIPNVGGRISDGFFQSQMNKNLMYLKLQMLAALGSYSDELLTYNLNINLVPVDVLTHAISQISMRKNKVMDTFHLGLEHGFTVSEILGALGKNGVAAQKVDHPVLLTKLEAMQSEIKNYAFALNKFGTYDKPGTGNIFSISSHATTAYLKEANINVAYDRLDYLSKLICYGVKADFLKVNDVQLVND